MAGRRKEETSWNVKSSDFLIIKYREKTPFMTQNLATSCDLTARVPLGKVSAGLVLFLQKAVPILRARVSLDDRRKVGICLVM